MLRLSPQLYLNQETTEAVVHIIPLYYATIYPFCQIFYGISVAKNHIFMCL